MARVIFTENIQRHVPLAETEAEGRTLRDVLEAVFQREPRARGYVLDDQGALRKHMIIYLDGRVVRDRVQLAEPVSAESRIYVFQALSGG